MINISIIEPIDWEITYNNIPSKGKKADMLAFTECRPENIYSGIQPIDTLDVGRLFRIAHSYLDKKFSLCDVESEWTKAQERWNEREMVPSANECTRPFRFQVAQEIAHFNSTFIEIETVWQARQIPGWDGYDAMPISRVSREDAIKFLRQLPIHFMQPDVVPENDGTIALEWQCGDSVFVVSFQGSGKLVYAGDFDNGRRTRGHENLAKGVPQAIATILGTEFATG